jgi:hypothetical protein
MVQLDREKKMICETCSKNTHNKICCPTLWKEKMTCAFYNKKIKKFTKEEVLSIIEHVKKEYLAIKEIDSEKVISEWLKS